MFLQAQGSAGIHASDCDNILYSNSTFSPNTANTEQQSHKSCPEHVSGEVVVQRANRQAACRLVVCHLVMLFAVSTLTSLAVAYDRQLPS